MGRQTARSNNGVLSVRRLNRRRKNTRNTLIALAAVVVMVVLTVGFLLNPGPKPIEVADLPPSPPASASSVATEIAQPVVAEPVVPMEFDVAQAIAELESIESYGVRKAGSKAERDAAQYVADRLTELGYAPTIETFPLSNGLTSQNVVARAEGASDTVVIVGGHLDSKAPSPGANDNASGCGAMLEIARILSEQPVVPTVEFVFFGSEEVIGTPDEHHFGSRFHAKNMSAAEISNTAGMLSVDMIGYGEQFCSRTMGKGPKGMSNLVIATGKELGLDIEYLKDPGKSGWSDHEAFELAGIPVSWIEWRNDPVYHTAKDTSPHIQPDKVDAAGRVTLATLRSLSSSGLDKLLSR